MLAADAQRQPLPPIRKTLLAEAHATIMRSPVHNNNDVPASAPYSNRHSVLASTTLSVSPKLNKACLIPCLPPKMRRPSSASARVKAPYFAT